MSPPPSCSWFKLGVAFPFSHQQELVNLLLTGRAVSNVFNDVVELDSGNGNITLLRGIAARSDIGFLSLFEHYNVCQVPIGQESPDPEEPDSLRDLRWKEGWTPLPRAGWSSGPAQTMTGKGGFPAREFGLANQTQNLF